MAIDLTHLPVPFRMQPGLRRLDLGEYHLTPLAPESRLYAEKLAVVQAGESRHSVPGFDAGPALAAIAARAELKGGATAAPVELAFEEDFAVLDGITGTLPWLCICVPSHWAPEDKLGLDFAAVHRPVADNAVLLAASHHLLALATSGECWERHVFTLSSSGLYDQHPRRQPRLLWPATQDCEAFARGCWLRAERQVFFPVNGKTGQAVFSIRVMLEPLEEVAAAPGAARRLHDWIASMSRAVLAYKGITPAREPLLRWLASRA
jgi:dimethylamine monooxygenase subunit A